MNQKSTAAIRKHALMSLWQLIRLVDEDDDGLLSGSAYATASETDAVRTPLWHFEYLGSPLRLERLATVRRCC
ncbi:hypothetical protein [Nocardia tengchongensis]|uniref:hypothetical protein n=1 Tax=Nocardia tengchongensis TaxID=2055889 RepID=UPI0036C722AE